jgi:hypothetical protein
LKTAGLNVSGRKRSKPGTIWGGVIRRISIADIIETFISGLGERFSGDPEPGASGIA